MDGMRSKVTLITILLIFCFVLIPLLISCIHTSGAAYIKEVGFEEHQHLLVVSNPVLTAGNFHCLDVTLTDDAHKISIVAYLGSEVPDVENRSIKNYYRWEYDNGKWLDKSGHESSYIKPSRCRKNGHIYSFYIGLDARADTGDWTIKISVDNKDVHSSPLNVETIHFNILLFTIYTNGLKLDKNDLPEFFKKHRKINHQEQTTTNKESLESIEAFIDRFLVTRSSFSRIKAFAVPVKKTSLYDELVDKLIKDHPSAQKIDEDEEIENYYEVEKTIVVDSHLKVSTKKGAIPPPIRKAYHQSFFSGGVPILVAFLLISLAFIPVITSFDDAPFSISSFTLFPDEIINGESVLLNVSVSDTAGITSVVADIGGLETVNLSLADETLVVNDTVYSGFYQYEWLARDVDPGTYTVMVTALNEDNRSTSAECMFTVLTTHNETNTYSNATTMESQPAEPGNNMTQSKNQTKGIIVGNDTTNDTMLNETKNATGNDSYDNTTSPGIPGVNASELNQNTSTNNTTPYQDEDNMTSNVTTNKTGNDTFASDNQPFNLSLNINLDTDKNKYTINETVFINGTTTYNNSNVETTINLTIHHLDNVFPKIINATNGIFSYEYIANTSGNYTVQVNAIYGNETAAVNTSFIVEQLIINIILTIWDDTDLTLLRCPGEQINFFANYSYGNTPIRNASCTISFNISGNWSKPVNMTPKNGFYVYNTSFENNGTYNWRVHCKKEGYENLSRIDQVIIRNTSTGNNITIVDKKHEQIQVLPGTRFYVERTIDGPHNTSVTFVPMFSDSLTFEKIEIIETANNNETMTQPVSSEKDSTKVGSKTLVSTVCNVETVKTEKETKIKQLRRVLPSDTQALDQFAYSNSFTLQSLRTVRIWFTAPTWEEIISGRKASSGETSYQKNSSSSSY